MISKRFIRALLLSAAIMCAASYFWHGIILTDFVRLNRSKGKLLSLSAMISVIIAYVMIKLYDLEFLDRHFRKQPLFRGLLVGAACGLVYFIISTAIGFSFNTSTNIQNHLVDVIWQIFEQSLGGLVISMVYIAMYDPDATD